MLLSSDKDYKTIVVMSDGRATHWCPDSEPYNGTGNNDFELADKEAFQAAESAKSNGIKVYTIGFGSGADEDALREIANKGGGEYYFSDTDSLEEIYNQSWTEIKRNYEAEEKWDHLRIIFYNATDSWIYEVYDVPAPLETKTYKIPEDKLSEHITDITEIKIYPVVYTEQGREVIGPILDSWKYEFE
jgi:4-hydroxyphenylpyruvate dioxygenase-like putative hemolysin